MAITTSAPYGVELEVMPLEAFGGVGGFKMKPIPGSLQLHGGSARKIIAPVVAIAAAVAAPVAIPAIAGAIAGSAAATAVTYAAAGALYGAAAGAATAAIGGGNIAQSALIGGAIGGVGGYIGAPTDVAGATATGASAGGAGAPAPLGTTASAAAPTAAPATGATVATGAPAGGAGLSTGFQSVGDITQQVAAGTAGPSFVSPVPTTAPASIGTQLSGVGGTAVPSVMAQAPVTPTFGATAPTGLGPTLGAAQAGQLATAPVAGAAAAPEASWGSNFSKALTDRFTDPRMVADLTLRAAGQLAGSAMAGSGLSEEQQQLVDMQMAELQQLQQTNKEAFNQRLEAAQSLLGEARYFDPEYFGLQRARQQQIAGAQAKRAGLRGMTGEERRAESRRYDIATARDVGTAYDQGYLTGVQGRLQTQQAGLNAMPMPSAYTASSYGGLSNTLADAERQRASQAQAIGGLFGGLTGYSASRSMG